MFLLYWGYNICRPDTNNDVLFFFHFVQIPEGNGSGVVWDEEGHIVTNYHGKD